MGLGRRTALHIERNTKTLETLFDYVVVAVNYILRSDSLLACALCNWHTVLIASADKEDIFALETQITYINVSRHIHSCKVTDVYRAVSIR